MLLEKKAVASAGYRDRVPSASNQNVRNGPRLPEGKLRSPGVIRSQERSMNVQHNRDRILKKQNGMTSNTQVKRQPDHARSQKKPIKVHPSMRKTMLSDEDDAFRELRKLLPRYNRYADDDDDDCKSMEADFTSIQMEEKRSARIAKKEDEEELAKIQEEERREKLRKQAKMRKLSQR